MSVIRYHCLREDRVKLESDPTLRSGQALSARGHRCQGRGSSRFDLRFSALFFPPWQWLKKR